MPTLKTFADRTGLPRERRWSDVYAAVEGLAAQAAQPAPASASTGHTIGDSTGAAAFPVPPGGKNTPLAKGEPGPDDPSNPGRLWRVSGYAKEVEDLARFMARGFYDWVAEGGETPEARAKYGPVPKADRDFHVPGVRVLHEYIDEGTGKAVNELDPEWETRGEYLRFTPNPNFPVKRDITVKWSDLRDDWEDDFKRALDAWAECGLNFIDVNHWTPNYGTLNYCPDIEVDDEQAGGYLHSNTSTAIDGVGQRYVDGMTVVHTSLRKINVSKAHVQRFPLHAFLHEIGHALGLGHPGKYPQYIVDPGGIGAPSNFQLSGLVGMIIKRPHERVFDADDGENTVMSYFGKSAVKLGDADRCAIEMIYG